MDHSPPSSPRSEYRHYPESMEGLHQVSFYDTEHGWAVGYFYDRNHTPPQGSIVLKTDNGGGSWTYVPPPAELSAEVKAVAAPDATHIWVGGSGGLFIREGESWTQVSGTSGLSVNRVSVRKEGSSYIGWAVGAGGAILHTTDGISWHTDTNPAAILCFMPFAATLSSVCEVDAPRFSRRNGLSDM